MAKALEVECPFALIRFTAASRIFGTIITPHAQRIVFEIGPTVVPAVFVALTMQPIA